MTMLITYGQRQFALWLGIKPNRMRMWIQRYDDWPEPDAAVSTPDETVRGWRRERLPEWRAYAAMREARAVQYGKGADRAKTTKTRRT